MTDTRRWCAATRDGPSPQSDNSINSPTSRISIDKYAELKTDLATISSAEPISYRRRRGSDCPAQADSFQFRNDHMQAAMQSNTPLLSRSRATSTLSLAAPRKRSEPPAAQWQLRGFNNPSSQMSNMLGGFSKTSFSVFSQNSGNGQSSTFFAQGTTAIAVRPRTRNRATGVAMAIMATTSVRRPQ